MGVIIFNLMGGVNPFLSETMPKMFNKIRKAEYSFQSEHFNNISDEGKGE